MERAGGDLAGGDFAFLAFLTFLANSREVGGFWPRPRGRRQWGRPARVSCRGRSGLRPPRPRCGARRPGLRREVIGVADLGLPGRDQRRLALLGPRCAGATLVACAPRRARFPAQAGPTASAREVVAGNLDALPRRPKRQAWGRRETQSAPETHMATRGRGLNCTRRSCDCAQDDGQVRDGTRSRPRRGAAPACSSSRRPRPPAPPGRRSAA